jgi:PAS domain S-box-containing protein
MILAPLMSIIVNNDLRITQLFYVLDTFVLLVALISYLYSFGIGLFLSMGGFLLMMFISVQVSAFDLFIYQLAEISLLLLSTQLMLLVTRRIETYEQTVARNALKESEARYRAIVDQQSELVCRWTGDDRLTFVNETYARWHGHTADALIGMSFYALLRSEEVAFIRPRIEPLYREPIGHIISYEAHYTRPDGERVWLAWTARAIDRPGGEGPIEYQAVGRDITQQKATEDALRASEARYRAIVDTQSELICRWKPDTTLTYVNGVYARYQHGVPGDFIGRRIVDLVTPDQRRIIEAEAEQVMQTRERYDNTRLFVTPHGGQRWMRWTNIPIFDGSGQIVEVQSVGYDLTEMRAVEDALRASEARYRAMVETQRDMICRWKPDLTITYVNQAYADYHELPAQAIVGRTVTEILATDEEREAVARYLEAVMPITAVQEHSEPFTSPCGKVSWIRWVDIPVFNEAGAVHEYQTVGYDLTAIKQAEDAARSALSRYEALVNTVDGVVWEIDPETWETLFISQQTVRLLGFQPEEFYASPLLWQSRIHPEDRPFVLAYVRAQLALGHAYEVDYRFITAMGRVVWLHDLVTQVTREDGLIIMRGISVDSTAAKLAQSAEAEQRRFAEALRETSAFISGTLDLDEVLNRILTVIPRVIPGGVTDIMMIDNGEAYVVGSRGYAERGLASAVHVLRIPIAADERLRYMMQTGEALLIDDVRDEPDWQDYGIFGWVRGQMSAPIRLEGETIGFLTVSDERPLAYTSKHAAQLQAFADQVSIAIRNARLYRAVRRYADHLEMLVAERTSELELERQRLQSILDSSGEGILYTEGNLIRFANAAFARLTGYQARELIDLSTALFEPDHKPDVPPETAQAPSRSLATLLRSTHADGTARAELVLRRRDGSVFDAGLTISFIAVGEDETERAVTVVRDISHEKALALQKSLFVAHASHELRTPLTNFKTRLYLLRRTPQRLEEHLNILDGVAERMRRLVEDLLDMSRFERGIIPMKRDLFDMTALLRRIVYIQQPEAERKNQQLTWSIPNGVFWIDGDEDRITQVLTNLITNAISYTPADGRVHIALRTDTQPDTPEAARSILIDVIDTGIGIKSADLAHIFQPFFRVMSTVEGTGLGLSISQAIVQQHGGTISVTSEPGKGSTFTLCLPLSTARALTPPQHDVQQG